MGGVESSKQILNLTQYAKDQIIIAANKTEQRLRDEQKSVRISKSLSFIYSKKFRTKSQDESEQIRFSPLYISVFQWNSCMQLAIFERIS